MSRFRRPPGAPLSRFPGDRSRPEAAQRKKPVPGRSLQLLRKLMDGVGPQIFVGLMTPEGILIEVNRQSLQAAGLKPEDVLGRPLDETYWSSHSERTRQRFREAIRRARQGEPSRFDVEIRIAENQFIPIDFSLQPVVDGAGGVTHLVPSGIVVAGRKRGEVELRENRYFLKKILDSEPGTVYIYDLVERRNVWINPHWTEHFGYEPDEMQSLGSDLFAQIIPPDDLARIAAHHQSWRQARDKDVLEFEYRLRDKAGQWHWLVNRETPFARDDSGRVKQVLGIAHDITGRKRAEEELRQREERLGRIIDAAPGGIAAFRLQPDGTSCFPFITPNHADIFGRHLLVEQLAQDASPIFALIHPDDLARVRGTIAESARTLSPWRAEYRVLNPEKGEIWAESYSIPVKESDGSILWTGFTLDISERKKAEETVRESRQFLGLALRVARIGWWMVDPATDQNYVSPEFREICGIPPDAEAPPFAKWAACVHPDDRDRFLARFQSAIRDLEQGVDLSVRFLHPDGVYRWLSTRGTGIKDAQGRLRVLGVTQDISELKQSEEDLRRYTTQLHELARRLQSSREEERTRIAREIHDELGHSLTAMRINLSWLSRKLAPQEKPLLDKLQVTIQLVDSTIDALRRIATELRPGVLDLGLTAAVEWQVNEFHSRTGIVCELSLPEEDSALNPELSTQLFRILQESLTNVARHAHATRVEVRLERTPAEILLEVRDNGRGFSDGSPSGRPTLGLLGMRERAALVGGTLTIQPAPARGTLVRCQVPLPPLPAPPKEPPAF